METSKENRKLVVNLLACLDDNSWCEQKRTKKEKNYKLTLAVRTANDLNQHVYSRHQLSCISYDTSRRICINIKTCHRC